MGLYDWLGKKVDLSDIQAAETVIGNLQDRLSMKAMAFHLATSYIADTISKCEIKHFVDGKEVKDDWYYLLNVSPNNNENASMFKSKLIFKLFYEGEALIFENGGNLYIADNYIFEANMLKYDKFSNISLDNVTRTFSKKSCDVFYFKLDDGKLKTLINSMLADYTELLKVAFDAYKSSNNEKYKLILDEVRTGNKDFSEKFNTVIKKQLETFINNSKAVYPQFKGQNLELMSGTNSGKTDSTDIRNLRKEIFEATAEAIKMPISMLYGNMTNAKDIINSFVTFRIDPLAKMLSEELTRKTVTKDDYSKGNYFDVDTTMVMHIDIFDITEKIDKLISSGVYCVDELRVKLGENVLDTEFSKQHWITRNYSPIEDMLNGEIETEKGGD